MRRRRLMRRDRYEAHPWIAMGADPWPYGVEASCDSQ